MTGRRSGGTVLVLYALSQHPLRASVRDHLYAFGRYSRHRCIYVNLAVRELPRWVLERDVDAVVLHTTLLSQRWQPAVFRQLCERAMPARSLAATNLAFPQDEFIHVDLLCEFLNAFGVDHVFSVAPASEWPKIYATLEHERPELHQVLTGYLEERTLARISRHERRSRERSIDIGYRAWEAAPWLGRHGILKRTIAEVVARRAPSFGVQTDISTRHEDTLLGDEWYRFLLRCRYIIGVEGGASVLDRDGTYKERTERFLEAHPDATFDEVERACFPGADGGLELLAISPRHLEACATRTVQILVESTFNGILQADEHYIPLREDFSDLDGVLARLGDEAARTAMADRAYRDVVASGRYTYRSFVSEVDDHVTGSRRLARPLHALARAADAASWLKVVWRVHRHRLRTLAGPLGRLR